jgi:hypothetical protein
MPQLKRGPAYGRPLVTAQLLHESNGLHGEPEVTANISMTWEKESADMRTTFNIELKVDVLTSDAKRLETFVELITTTARMLYGSAAMIASKPPQLSVTSVGLHGKTDHDIFEGEEFNSGE